VMRNIDRTEQTMSSRNVSSDLVRKLRRDA
jgi:hypothetical protein